MSKNEFFCVYDHETQSINSNKKINPLTLSKEIYKKQTSSSTKKTKNLTTSFSPIKKLKPIFQKNQFFKKKKKIFSIFLTKFTTKSNKKYIIRNKEKSR